jgi:hypothetical protein
MTALQAKPPIPIAFDLLKAGSAGIDADPRVSGWLARWVGADLPREEIAQAVLAHCFQADLIVTKRRLDEETRKLEDCRDQINGLKRRLAKGRSVS